MKKNIRHLLLGILILLTLLVCAGYYMLGYALQPKDLVERSRNIAGSLEMMTERYPHLCRWIDSLTTTNALHQVSLTGVAGETLQGYYVAAAQPTDRTAVIVHGYTDNALRMLMIGYLYSHELGYNILLPDLHAHGLSEGQAIRMGWLDRLDVMQWMDYADELFGNPFGSTRMVVHGISMGAATVMMLAGEEPHLMPYARCFVEDCGYTSVWDEFRSELKGQFGLPTFPLLHLTSLLCQMEYGWNFREASALKQVARCQLPMLFIHGENDTFVPTAMVHTLYQAKPEPKTLWIAPGSAHAMAYHDHPQAYTAQVKAFVEQYIPQENATACDKTGTLND